MPVENQVLAWDRYKKVAGLNQFIVSQPLDNWIQRQYRHKQTIKNLHRSTSVQKDHSLTQKNIK